MDILLTDVNAYRKDLSKADTRFRKVEAAADMAKTEPDPARTACYSQMNGHTPVSIKSVAGGTEGPNTNAS